MLIFSPLNMASMRLRKSRFLGQPDQKLECFVGHKVFRIVKVKPDRLGRHSFAALGVLGEEAA